CAPPVRAAHTARSSSSVGTRSRPGRGLGLLVLSIGLASISPSRTDHEKYPHNVPCALVAAVSPLLAAMLEISAEMVRRSMLVSGSGWRDGRASAVGAPPA